MRYECIGEDVLKAEILRDGRPGECAYCANEDEPSVTIAALARRVDDVFREVVGIAREEVTIVGGRVDFGPSGESPSLLMAEMTEAADEEIGQDIVSYLSDRHQWGVNAHPAGHYARPDVTRLWFDPSPRRPVMSPGAADTTAAGLVPEPA